jgi:hypothetical protein
MGVNSDHGGSSGKGTCFVAHVFGHKSIVTRSLRLFRDNVLLKLPYGERMTGVYYQRLSPILMRHLAFTTAPGRKEFKEVTFFEST